MGGGNADGSSMLAPFAFGYDPFQVASANGMVSVMHPPEKIPLDRDIFFEGWIKRVGRIANRACR